VRSLILLVLVAACGTPPAPRRAGTETAGTGAGTVTKPGDPQRPPATTGPIKDVGCLAPTCAFHAGAAAYFTCQSGGAGTCFHFGAPCTPADACMYDPVARSYKQCTQATEGTCQAWGAACAPASKCMFDATDNMHRTCEAVDGGTCKRYGALCAP